ncbi:hypothetical protein EN866_33850 [Mesorhizobium sp. M2D.F.Ca.ET.223.01.1.1]|uniref:DUF6173 family protein n=1 Tax=Mesorhizobium sp. M2D.F.Ca.ET.223.01.1.1 TaxID=2563940 RepID=UPI0010923098|nr:DUF6173 family protein [Mesorhizobium sp. M2D.F.Ca.ET.223.01.1.1]TGR83612.1 hypothetical protein EN866_33850 [Mesorhizobium sp. M2D.F.Ca.ET.223.01.1.1]TGT74564.1 hypothetical protein EN802_12015 [bacterium M00.F.Ca.ET.159.01.1.1]TGT86814.1 hypothetical protein EN800_08905 [bacterium M00.F.Ca.ET.157.01.1.1]
MVKNPLDITGYPERAFRLPSFNLPTSTTNPAKWAYERIVRSIIDFEKQLDPTQEIGARLVNFGAKEVIHIDDVGFWGPDLVKFFGQTVDGNPVELIQHISQVSVMLVAIKTKEEPRRIGFVLEKQLKANTSAD